MKKRHPILFTKEGYEKIKTDKQRFILERKEAVVTLKESRELGDLSENGLYKAARAKLSSIDNRIDRLDGLLKFGIIAGKPIIGEAGIGSRVQLSESSKIREYYIVGDYEANPLEGKISYTSPLGKEIVGKKAGDNITVTAPKGQIFYKIIKIS